MAGDYDEMFMTRSLSVTPKTTEHHAHVYAVINLKPQVTNNRRVRSTFCTIEAKLANY